MPNTLNRLRLGEATPTRLNELSGKRIRLHQRFTRLLMLPGIFNCNAYLVCEGAENLNIFLVEGIGLNALHIECADHLFADPQWQGDFRACFRQIRVVEEYGIRPSI